MSTERRSYVHEAIEGDDNSQVYLDGSQTTLGRACLKVVDFDRDMLAFAYLDAAGLRALAVAAARAAAELDPQPFEPVVKPKNEEEAVALLNRFEFGGAKDWRIEFNADAKLGDWAYHVVSHDASSKYAPDVLHRVVDLLVGLFNEPRILEVKSCSTPSGSADLAWLDTDTWCLLMAFVAGEHHHGADVSEGRMTEILMHRLGWTRIDLRRAWYDAIERGNRLIEEDNIRMIPIHDAEIAAIKARAARRKETGLSGSPGPAVDTSPTSPSPDTRPTESPASSSITDA